MPNSEICASSQVVSCHHTTYSAYLASEEEDFYPPAPCIQIVGGQQSHSWHSGVCFWQILSRCAISCVCLKVHSDLPSEILKTVISQDCSYVSRLLFWCSHWPICLVKCLYFAFLGCFTAWRITTISGCLYLDPLFANPSTRSFIAWYVWVT